MSRFWATITIVVLSVLVFALLRRLFCVPLLLGQLSAFLDRLPDYVTQLQALGNRFFDTRIGQFFKTQATADRTSTRS